MIPLKKLFSLFEGKEKSRVLILTGMIFIGACLEMVGVGLVFPFITLIADPSLAEQYRVFSYIRNIGGGISYNNMLIMLGSALLLFYIVKNVFIANLILIQNRFKFKKMRSLSLSLFSSYLNAPYTYHIKRNSSELQRNITTSMIQVFNILFTYTLYLISDSLVLMAIMLLLIVVNPLTTIIAGSVIIIGSALFLRITRNKVHALGKLEHQYIGKMIKWVNQGLAGIKEAKILGNEDFFLDQYGYYCDRYVRSRRFTATVQELPRLFLETLAVGGLLTVVILFLLQKRDIQSVLPLIALFAAAAFRIIPATNRIINSLTVLKQYGPALDDVLEDLNLVGSVAEEPSMPASGTEENQSKEELSFRKEVVLEDIRFRYPDTEGDVLCGISLKIRRGQSIAFVGPSGSGKSTVVDVILGLLKPEKGKVIVDGIDIRENLRGWQNLFGYIPQSIYLMDDTVRRNVAFGVKDGLIDDDSVWKALRSAQIDDFIRKLPEDLDTRVGEGGVRFSGGQRQRIGIARALYHNPEILVLDEATSSLDNETEQAVADAIRRLAGEKTVIIIAHRLSTVKNCDCLFFFREGHLAGSGTYSHLINSSTAFQAMAGQR